MQEVPGFGVVRSDNPIVAEVLGIVARDMYPEGHPVDPGTPEESHARLADSELLNSVGGIDLVVDFAQEVAGLNVHPVALMMDPLTYLGSAFSIGVQVGVALARRAADSPVIE